MEAEFVAGMPAIVASEEACLRDLSEQMVTVDKGEGASTCALAAGALEDCASFAADAARAATQRAATLT